MVFKLRMQMSGTEVSSLDCGKTREVSPCQRSRRESGLLFAVSTKMTQNEKSSKREKGERAGRLCRYISAGTRYSFSLPAFPVKTCDSALANRRQ